MSTMEIDQEIVYGTHEDSHVVMSEKVQSLAGSIYQEFERMISKYDEEVVKDLMPLVVNVLECLDLSYTENQEHEVELELLREDNEQLVTQYEREKQLRKTAEQKLLETEDAGEDERKDLGSKIESLESIVRMLELKAKNSSDHVFRLEEKEAEMKKEYSKLHERYTELFKTHVDYMERTKILLGSDRLESLGGSRPRISGMNLGQLNRSSGPVSFGFSSLESSAILDRSRGSPNEYDDSGGLSPPTSIHSATSLHNELLDSQASELPEDKSPPSRSAEKGGWVDGLSPELQDQTPDDELPTPTQVEELNIPSQSSAVGPRGSSKTKREQRSGNTLYQELSFQDAEALVEIDEGADITESSSDDDSGNEERNKTRAAKSTRNKNVNDNFFGMGKEVENLIMENNELLATKNALNIVKDDLIVKVDELTSEQEILHEEIRSLKGTREKLKNRISDLEDEVKKTKEEAEKAAKANKSDDEEDVPMAQRKRFTRVEMARAIMERNQYKERFVELQEAVRWSEMIRATRSDASLDKKTKQSAGIFKFFSNLFSADRPQDKMHPYVNVHYNAPTHHVRPALDTMRKRSLKDRKRAGMEALVDGDLAEKLHARQMNERREQYRQVRAHVRKDDGRMQAYGWSLPAKGGTAGGATPPPSSAQTSTRPSSGVPVPVPVYCRPLAEGSPGMKVWCAAGVNLTGGRTRDGGSIVGASVFYSNPPAVSTSESTKGGDKPRTEIEELDRELQEGQRAAREAQQLETHLSSLVWICTSTHATSRVTVLDANNPADILESFTVCNSHLLCITSVPGAKESDYPDEPISASSEATEASPPPSPSTEGVEEATADTEDGNVGRLTFVSCSSGDAPVISPDLMPADEALPIHTPRSCSAIELHTLANPNNEDQPLPPRRLLKEMSGLVKDGLAQVPKENEHAYEEVEKMSSVLPTMWLGSQNGGLYIHSAVSQWRHCLHYVKLKDPVLSIIHVHGRVLAALANGSVVIFRRGGDGQWELGKHHVLDLGAPHHSIRCMTVVHSSVWCGYRNRIHVVDPRTMAVEKSFDVHPRKESQVRQLAWLGDGVWVSIRLDSTLRLYHAHTHQHLQDVDIEPYVSKMLAVFPGGTGKLGFSLIRITALLISSNRLWIGTGNGVIISVPLSESAGGRPGSSQSSTGSVTAAISPPSSSTSRGPGGVVRVYSDTRNKLTPGSFIPYCSMAQAQLSFHGHRDAVKFFVAVPGAPGLSAATTPETPAAPADEEGLLGELGGRPHSMLVMSGGEGYIDFRIGDGTEEEDDTYVDEADGTLRGFSDTHSEYSTAGGGAMPRFERSHLIVWQVTHSD